MRIEGQYQDDAGYSKVLFKIQLQIRAFGKFFEIVGHGLQSGGRQERYEIGGVSIDQNCHHQPPRPTRQQLEEEPMLEDN